MAEPDTNVILEKLQGLQTELVDRAFELECRGQLDAADVAMTTSARIREFCDELSTHLGRRTSSDSDAVSTPSGCPQKYFAEVLSVSSTTPSIPA